MLKNMFGGSESDSDSNSNSDDGSVGGTRASLPSSSASTAAIAIATAVAADNDPTTTTVETYRSLTGTFEVLLHQQRQKGIAHQLWPAATFLSHYLEQHPDVIFGPGGTAATNGGGGSGSGSSSDSGSGSGGPVATSVIELGAGIGLCGLVCSKLKCDAVVLTDLPVALPLLETNIAINHQGGGDGEVTAMVLSWGCDDDLLAVMRAARRHGPDQRVVAIAADCVYWEVLFAPFFATLRALVLHHSVDVVIAHVKVRKSIAARPRRCRGPSPPLPLPSPARLQRWKRDEKFFKMCRRCLTVDVLLERVDMVPHEHTGVPTKEIKRIYRISKPA